MSAPQNQRADRWFPGPCPAFGYHASPWPDASLTATHLSFRAYGTSELPTSCTPLIEIVNDEAFWSLSASRLQHVVLKLNNAVRESLRGPEPERHLTMPRGNNWNALADERRHNGDDELVNRALIEERSDDLTSAHHPNVLASLLAESSANDWIDSWTNSTPGGVEAGGGWRENT